MQHLISITKIKKSSGPNVNPTPGTRLFDTGRKEEEDPAKWAYCVLSDK